VVRLGVSVLDWVGICILGGRQLQRRRVIADAYRVPAVTEGLPTQPDTGFPEKLTPVLPNRPDTPAQAQGIDATPEWRCWSWGGWLLRRSSGFSCGPA
jgi:hypothetical protein